MSLISGSNNPRRMYLDCLTPKKQALYSSETSITICQSIWWNNTDDLTLHQYCFDGFEPPIDSAVLVIECAGVQSEGNKLQITVHLINFVLRRPKSKPYISACSNNVRIGRTCQSEQEATVMGRFAVEHNHSIMVDVTLCRVSNISCPTSEAWNLLNTKWSRSADHLAERA